MSARPLDAPRKTRVLVIDDSALMRSLLVDIIDRESDMVAVGAARDPLVAREMIRELDPDVVTLDIEMPRMDGLDFLEKLMRLRPMPVVMISTMTESGADATLRALELGAVDFVAKPRLDVARGVRACGREIVEKIRTAAIADIRRLPRSAPNDRRPHMTLASTTRTGTEKVIVVGSSTGGTEALRQLLVPMPPDAPGIVVAQHMPAGFTSSFARRLDALCRIGVSEAADGERILPGHAYIAPGGRHLRVRRDGANYVVALADDARINLHRPSVEALFLSAAQALGANAIGVILTGMGDDGATAMLALKRAGAWTIAQDEATCVVFGMPRAAIAAGGVDTILPIGDMAYDLLASLPRETVRHRM